MTPSRRIIGISGRARSGKDTAALSLSEFGFVRRAFADPLKLAAKAIFCLVSEQLYGNAKDVVDPFWGQTPRAILQQLGTECLRNGYAPDVWVRSMERWLAMNTHGGQKVVIPDVRFPEEPDAILRWGGEVWLVRRDGAGASGSGADHVSEHALDGATGFSATIDNNGSLADLREKVVALMAVQRG